MQSVVDRIYKYYEKENDKPPRDYLGASQLGADCERAIWYDYRWAKKKIFSGRMHRLFARGRLEEERLISDLKNALFATIQTIDPFTSEQLRAEAFEGHFSGSMDSIATGIDLDDPEKLFVLEFKTHNDRSYNDLVKNKVKNSKRQHYVQMQLYMGLFNIDQALYLAVNKDIEALYEEIVYFDKEMFDALMNKAERLIWSEQPPERINENISFYKCKMCDFKNVCHKVEKMDMNCRTCIHSEPMKNATWGCNKFSRTLDFEDQLKGCNKHDPIT